MCAGVQVTTLGAAEREFHGFSGKAASQMPKGDKALATASINCNMVRGTCNALRSTLSVLHCWLGAEHVHALSQAH